jgi:transposase
MKNEYTIGLDLSDKSIEVCVINAAGEVVRRVTIVNHRKELISLSKDYAGALMVMEAGTHSAWISRQMKKLGHKVYVGNPRKLRLIYDSDNKTDERDAEMLARLGRFDPKMLYPISHNSEECQRALAKMKCRDSLVSNRTSMINTVRGLLKSFGVVLSSSWSAESFSRKTREHLESTDLNLVEQLLNSIEALSMQIKALDKEVDRMIEEEYPQARRLLEVPGVGPLTALAFILILESPDRFKCGRDVGPFLGLTPKRDQSGDRDKQLRISKAGNKMLRRYLVNCAQYILGYYGPPSALRASGERISHGGGKIAKKKAVTAVARKLATLLMVLWKNPELEYEPFPCKTLKVA